MNGLDLLLVVLLALAALAGFRRGALLQVLSYGGLLAGLLVGALAGPWLARPAESTATQAGIAVGSLLVGAGVGNALGWAAGTALRSRAHRTSLRTADAAGGLVVSVVATLLAIWFLGLNLVNGPFLGVAREVRGSAVVRVLAAALPQPPSILGEVGRFLDRFGFPQVFTGLPPAPAGPVTWPRPGEARLAFASAAGSTVRVVGEACGRLQSGTGFLVGGNYVVTAAHVVAGVGDPVVQQQGGDGQPATPVLYDPRMDLAVLFVEAPTGPSLPLATFEADRGDGGAVLGYPGGGDLEGHRAAVRRTMTAIGRDIYGRHEVRREVYELQADVAAGDSGGPFVLPDGRVAGMVVAASTVEDRLGYAITSTELIPEVEAVVGQTATVATGACLR